MYVTVTSYVINIVQTLYYTNEAIIPHVFDKLKINVSFLLLQITTKNSNMFWTMMKARPKNTQMMQARLATFLLLATTTITVV